MRKLTPKRKKWLLARAVFEVRRRQRKLNPERRLPVTGGHTNNPPGQDTEEAPSRIPLPKHVGPYPEVAYRRGSRRKIAPFLQPPAVFSLRQNYGEVASFLAHLRHEIYRTKPQRVGIDFEALKHVSTAAALILAAELYRWQATGKRSLRAARQKKWDPKVAHVLESMGLFDFLETPNFDRRRHSWPEADISVLKYRLGTDVVGERCEDLLAHLTEISGPVEAENFIYDGLIEALKNSRQHAYSEPDVWFGVDPGTWFMAGSYDRSSSSLTAAVFDLGVGIPRTLPRATFWEKLRPFLTTASDDAKMIEAAMEYGRSRTERQERGNGLPTMMRILDYHKGYLRIISGTGEVVYDSVTKTMKTTNHRIPIGGTLIEWSISR